MSRPVAASRAIAVLAVHELRLAMRRGENLLVTLVIPPAVLAFFSTAGVVPTIEGPPVDFLLPGAIALAVIANGLVNLGIATAYDRHYGVLKRLGVAPVGRGSVIAARLVAVLAIEVLQVLVLLAVAAGPLGWRPAEDIAPLVIVGAILLGTLAFAGLGLLLAGTLRAEAVLALANGLFLVFLMLGGIVLPLDHLTGVLETIGRLLPAAALSDLLRVGFGAGGSGDGDGLAALVTLAAWASATTIPAARAFRWD